ncbi:MAG: DUF6519 domain-containing protein, partial [Acidobacteriota bacterium]
MKSDSSRFTFDPSKHFTGVRMQQGRVQIDADGNEQSDIFNHRVETEASDVIGVCGGPIHNPAFHIVSAISHLSAEEQALPANRGPLSGFSLRDFLISAGRYYVDGILCENEKLTSYLSQPDLPRLDPDIQPVIGAAGLYLIYVDVWQRLLTALDDPSVREIALGGPDTAARVKTVWQVKAWFAGEAPGNCLTRFTEFEGLIAPSDGKLSVRTKPAAASTDPCIVPPGAGYTGLENQLYRIEIHDTGDALDASNVGLAATKVPDENNQIRVGGTWKKGQALEIFSSQESDGPLKGTLAFVRDSEVRRVVDTEGGRRRVSRSQVVTLNLDVSRLPFDEFRVRAAEATFKWSRDNGAVVTTIEQINVQDRRELTVHDLGPDDALGFKVGQWVEIIDDGLELNGQPGQLEQITKVDSTVNLITLSDPAWMPLDPTRHPKLRRWDGLGAAKINFMDLENGVQVRFVEGSFRTGDFWTAAARTATADTQSGNIEWPREGNQPVAQLPSGINHRYCRLAMAHWNGESFDVVRDCRNLFPPITELTSLSYVSGDGQEAMPDIAAPAAL